MDLIITSKFVQLFCTDLIDRFRQAQYGLRGLRVGEAAHPGPRLRRRGPRSFAAREARRQRRSATSTPARTPVMPGIELEKSLAMLHLNMRGYLSHIAEVTALLRRLVDKPFLVTLNETFLTKAVENVELEGYQVLARRDRVGQWGGGVLVFVLDEFASRVTLVEVSEKAERVWAVVHSDQGPYLVCCWYRPPNPGNTESIDSFEAEYKRHRDGALGSFVLGDLNVHSVRWLRFWARESVEGRALADVSRKFGFKQLVSEPTRGDHLLDIVLSDVRGSKSQVVSAVADHKGVLTRVIFKMPEVATHSREVWHFQDADWERLCSEISETNWGFLEATEPSAGAEALTDRLLELAEASIPKRTVQTRKSSHPWLTEKGEEAVKRKHAAQGTESENEAARECSRVLMEEWHGYVRRTREKLAGTKTSSKSWWSKARRLLDQRQQVSSIPALKKGADWIIEIENKANYFADVFEAKNVMIAEEANNYSEIVDTHTEATTFKLPSLEATKKVLEGLDEDSALGPDMLPTRILKKCAHVLAPAVHALLMSILFHGVWPLLWRIHWVIPLHKRKSVYDPRNYRGIHLTAQLSKVAERVFASMFVPRLVEIGAFGENQFAYMPERGARDALAQLLLKWISLFGQKRKIAVYCSDVSGAFDKVNARRLLRKLKAKGVPEDILRVLKSWLAARKARVAVGGKYSRDMDMQDMVYQGTVLGPPLWNVFYADAATAVHVYEFLEIIFADDLNAFKDFALTVQNATLYEEMRRCQGELHKWGRANQVSFDASKESMHILAFRGGQGPNFRLLGIPFDNGLAMGDAIHEIVGEVSWKMGSILRTTRFFCDRELVNLYKSKLLSFLEYRTAAIYHACDSAIAPLNMFQERFLQELGISAEEALFEFHLAPLACRRDMAMLGFIHRCVLGKGPAHFREFFKLDGSRHLAARARQRRHNRQLADIRERHFSEMERRSALGLIFVYNRLPADIVAQESVKGFQHCLQEFLKDRVSEGCLDWRDSFSPRIPAYRHLLR